MDNQGEIDTRSAIICALAVFTLYSIVNILQSPITIGDDVSQSTILSLSKACSALLLALYIIKVGISFRRLLMVWGIAVFFFVSSPVLGLLSNSVFSDNIYFLALGLATSTGLIVITILLAQFHWSTIKYIIIIQHMLAGFVPYTLSTIGLTDIKASEYFFYVLLAIGAAILIATKGISPDYEAAMTKTKPKEINSQSRNQLIVIAMAIGGAALAPFLFGVFESLIRTTSESEFQQPIFALINNLGIPLFLLIVFLFKKEISIEASFFLVSIVSFIFLLIALFDPQSISLLYLVSQTLVTYFHLAIWLFIFKTGKAGLVNTGALMGISVFTISFSRMCGNLTAHAAQAISDAPSAIDTVTLWTLAVFALINLSLFVVTYLLQKRTAEKALGEPVENTESSLESRAQLLAEQYALSPREHQILLEYAAGRSAPFIAQKYYLSVFTVKNYISRIYSKMDIHSRQELLDMLETEGDETI